MTFDGKVVVITGGAGGIGAALAEKLKAAGARLCLADRDETRVARIAQTLGVMGRTCDVTCPDAVDALVTEVRDNLGMIDIFVSNAGIFHGQPDHAASASDDCWALNWSVHVMAHVYAARCLLPEMRARQSGMFIQVVSAAGMLNQIGDAAYSASKHAAVSFAESLAIEHGDDGIRVCLVCPQYVATGLIGMDEKVDDAPVSLITVETAADHILEGAARGDFLILPHPQVRDYVRFRAEDHDAWIAGMRALKRKARESGLTDPKEFYRVV